MARVGSLAIVFLLAVLCAAAPVPPAPAMPPPGERVWVGSEYSFVYGFAKKPSLGTAVLRLELSTRDGRATTELRITGSSDMPSMRGHHATGEQLFRVSKRGEYLLPVDLVMPGEWEVVITVSRAGKVLYRGAYRFHV